MSYQEPEVDHAEHAAVSAEQEASADYYDQAWVVETFYNTHADGAEVAEDDDDPPRTLHGTFDSLAEAKAWMDAQPDDTDVAAMYALNLNLVPPRGATSYVDPTQPDPRGSRTAP